MNDAPALLEHGTVFGKLTVLRRATNTKGRGGNVGNVRYRCGCACGYGRVIVRGRDLRSGKVKACVKCSGLSE